MSNDLTVTPLPASGLARLGALVRLTYEEARRDGIPIVSGSLAFVTILSLVPLLAVFAFLGTRAFERYEEQLLQLLQQVLPYPEERLLRMLDQFVTQAEEVQGIGAVFFLVTVLMAFNQVEAVINRIWNVDQKRPLRDRLLSFTLLLFWGPLLVGATLSGLVYLRQVPQLEPLLANPLWLALQPAIVLVGLSMLYWMVPFATVRFRSALLGAFTATLMLEALRYGMRLYIANFASLSLVYGSFGFALLFMVSIELAWLAVLAGAELTYVHQHLPTLARMSQRRTPIPGAWLALLAISKLADFLQQGEPLVSFDALETHLETPVTTLRRALSPLLDNGLVQETQHGLVIARPLSKIRVHEILDFYEDPRRQLLSTVSPALAERLENLRQQLVGQRTKTLRGLTLEALIEQARAREETT